MKGEVRACDCNLFNGLLRSVEADIHQFSKIAGSTCVQPTMLGSVGNIGNVRESLAFACFRFDNIVS